VLIEALNPENWPFLKADILAIESSTYEPSRRDSPDFLEKIVTHPKSLSLIARINNETAGFCLGAPLDLFSHVRGPREDTEPLPSRVLYSADTCVCSQFRRQGVGRALKQQQIQLAQQAGFQAITGRNRAGLAQDMWRLNRSLGARAFHIIENDYNDDLTPNLCIYYRINLTP